MDDIGFVIFSFFNVIWATLYLESWKRRSAELSHQWGTIDTKSEMLSEPRVQYQVMWPLFSLYLTVTINIFRVRKD